MNDRLKFCEEVLAAPATDNCVFHGYDLTSHADGYLLIYVPGGNRTTAHRYVCERRHGPPPSRRHQASHSCGRSQCCNPAHLDWKTPKQNQADREQHGTLTGISRPPQKASHRRISR